MDPSESIETDETYLDLTDRYANVPEIIRNTFEKNKISSVVEKLKEIINFSQTEINKLCRENNESLLDSLNGLDQLKTIFHEIHTSCKTLNTQVDSFFLDYNESIKELQKYRLIERNVAATLDFLLKCLPAIKIDKIFDKSIHSYSYIEMIDACNVLEESTDIVFKDASVVKQIYSNIPKVRQAIKSNAIENLKTFLNISLEKFPEIGLNYWACVVKSLGFKSGVLDQTFRDLPHRPVLAGLDFAPIYWYGYILNALNCDNVDFEFYMEQRKRQLLLIFNQTVKINKNDSMDQHIASMLYAVVGYFIVEHYILHTVKYFVTQDSMNDNFKTISNSILVYLGSVINTHDHYKQVPEIKVVLGRFDSVLETLDIESDTLNQSVKVFSNIFFKVMGSEILVTDSTFDVNNHFVTYMFGDQVEETAKLGYFCAHAVDTTEEFPVTRRFPVFINELMRKYLKLFEDTHARTRETPTRGDNEGDSEQFESLIGFCDIAMRQLNSYYKKAKTDDMIVIAFYNCTFMQKYFGDVLSKYSTNMDYQAQIDNFRQTTKSLMELIKSNLKEIVRERIYAAFVHFEPEYNPVVDVIDIHPVIQNMFNDLTRLLTKLSVVKSPIFDEIMGLISGKISDNFVSFLTLNSYNSCNSKFLAMMLNHMNHGKLTLLELIEPQMQHKIEHDFEEGRQTINIPLIDDWQTYFDNFGLSFSPYNRTKPDVMLKVATKLANSASAASIKDTFNKFFTNAKKPEMKLNEVITTLQKLLYKS